MDKKISFANWLLIFIAVMLLVNAICTLLLYRDTAQMGQALSSIQESVYQLELAGDTSLPDDGSSAIAFYRELSDKTDNAIGRLFTVVAIFTALFTFFSMLLAFKAPHDIDRRIDELKEEILRQSKVAESAEYQSKITNALRHKTPFERLKALSKIIKQYPAKPDAYSLRGSEYDEL